MKKFYSFLCALAIVLSASAAPLHKVVPQKTLSNQPLKVEQAVKAVKAPKAKAETPFASGTFYTTGGTFYVYGSSGWSDATSSMPSIDVTVEGDQVTIVGLAYWFEDGAITGTLADNVITCANGQLLGTDEYGDEFLVGSNDGSSVAENIEFEYDPEAGTLTSITTLLVESASDTSLQAYCYWVNAVFSLEAPEAPETVVVPEDLVVSLYKFTGYDTYYEEDVTKYVNVGFDGDDVFIKGMSDYVADGWIKGTKNTEGIFEFPAVFIGVYESFLGDMDLYSIATSMTYDAEKDQFSCDEFATTASGYTMDEFTGILLSKFTEVAAIPADPSFEDFVFAGATYPYVDFNIPLTGTNGEDLNPEKLSYIFFIQKGNEESPLVLTPDLYENLEADLTEIPYTFSDDYDIYNNRLYLNQGEEEARTWEKLGLQTIFRGGDEEHKSNIVWFDVKAYWEEVDKEEGIENVVLTDKAQKVSVDGQLFIIRDGKMFNALGTQVR